MSLSYQVISRLQKRNNYRKYQRQKPEHICQWPTILLMYVSNNLPKWAQQLDITIKHTIS